MFCPSQKSSCAPKSSHLVFSLSTTMFLHSPRTSIPQEPACIAEQAEFFSEEPAWCAAAVGMTPAGLHRTSVLQRSIARWIGSPQNLGFSPCACRTAAAYSGSINADFRALSHVVKLQTHADDAPSRTPKGFISHGQVPVVELNHKMYRNALRPHSR